jgi:hypothetical protein
MIADMSFPMNKVSQGSANIGGQDSFRTMDTPGVSTGITTTTTAERGT